MPWFTDGEAVCDPCHGFQLPGGVDGEAVDDP